jgi:hypothetical protein
VTTIAESSRDDRRSRARVRSRGEGRRDGGLDRPTSPGGELLHPGAPSDIYAMATTTDLALLATLIHDAIAHLMNAIHRAADARQPLDRIADAMEQSVATMKIAVKSRAIRTPGLNLKPLRTHSMIRRRSLTR